MKVLEENMQSKSPVRSIDSPMLFEKVCGRKGIRISKPVQVTEGEPDNAGRESNLLDLGDITSVEQSITMAKSTVE